MKPKTGFPIAWSTAFLLAAAPAHAWPFAANDWNQPGDGSMLRMVPFQADADRRVEFIAGGRYLQRDGGGPAVAVTLPAPDTDPYPAGTAKVGFGRNFVTTGDIDGDGDTDLVRSCLVTYENDPEQNFRMAAYLNNGAGTYTIGWQWKTKDTTKFPYSFPVHLADLDGDGDLDLIEGYAGLRVRWNDGSGSFGGASTLVDATVNECLDFRVEDFNGDGHPDLVMGGIWYKQVPDSIPQRNGYLVLQANNGNGTFAKSVISALGDFVSPEQIELMDVDRDGRQDLLVSIRSRSTSSRLVRHRNNGSGFNSAVHLTTGEPEIAIPFAIGDLDEDGHPDLAYSTKPNQLQWRRSTGPSAFAPEALLTPASPETGKPGGIAVADHDGDGDMDILWEGGLRFMENTALSSRRPRATSTPWAGTSPSGTVALAVGDLNGDGKEDLVATDPPNERLLWYAGGSTLGGHFPISTAGQTPTRVVTGDLDGDGDDDLAWTNGSQVWRALNAFGTGLGWYQQAVVNFPGANCLAIGDLDRDGDLDLLVGSTSSGTVQWMKNNGSATAWTTEFLVTGISGLSRIAVGQTRPGGAPEVHVISNSGMWREYQRNQAGTWLVASTKTSPSGTSSGLVLADIEGDRHPDAAHACGHSTNGIVTAPGGHPVATPGEVRSLAAADWDGDGLTDLLSATVNGVTLHANNSASGNSWSSYNPITGKTFSDVVIIDLNHDGVADAVAAESVTGKLHLIRNNSADITVSHSLVKPAGTALRIFPGAAADAMTVTAFTHGKSTPPAGSMKDADTVPAWAGFRFRRAVSSANGWVPGSAMTEEELSAAVQSISFGGITAIPSPLPGGRFTMTFSPVAQSLLKISPGTSRGYAIGVKLKATAGSAPVTRFFVDHLAGGVSDATSWNALCATGADAPHPLRTYMAQGTGSALIEVAVPGPLEQWRKTHFNTYLDEGNAGNDADPDGDGVPNLIEYLMSRNPKGSSEIGGRSAPLGMTSSGPNVPLVADLRLLSNYDPKLVVTVEQSLNLASWSTLSTRTGTGAWSGVQPSATTLGGGRTRFEFTTPAAPASTPRYFLRLRAEELP